MLEARALVTVEQIEVLMAPLGLVYGLPEGARAGAFWGAYAKVLGSLHPHQLRHACDAYLASDARFFPKPGELLALAKEATPDPLMVLACHAHAALDYKPEPVREVRREVFDAVAEAAKTRAMMAARRAPEHRRVPDRPKNDRLFPPTPVGPDGLSAVMRAKLEAEAAA